MKNVLFPQFAPFDFLIPGCLAPWLSLTHFLFEVVGCSCTWGGGVDVGRLVKFIPAKSLHVRPIMLLDRCRWEEPAASDEPIAVDVELIVKKGVCRNVIHRELKRWIPQYKATFCGSGLCFHLSGHASVTQWSFIEHHGQLTWERTWLHSVEKLQPKINIWQCVHCEDPPKCSTSNTPSKKNPSWFFWFKLSHCSGWNTVTTNLTYYSKLL